MKNPWKRISSKQVYKNPWISVREDKVVRPDGKRGIYGILEKPPGVFVVAYDKGYVYLIRQFRYPIQKVIYEIPAGVVTDRKYLSNAKRELFEETGIKAKTWRLLGNYYGAAGHETTQFFAYLATGLNTKKMQTTAQDGDESILGIKKVSITQLKLMLLKNQISCGISLAAFSLFFVYFDRLNKFK